MTKIQTIKALKAEITRRIANAQHNITQMQGDENPQVQAMIVKNQGYLLALDDIEFFMLQNRI